MPMYFEFYMSGKLIKLCHDSPKECDILIYGDIQVAYIENFKQKTLVNLGSVGVSLKVS
jgi:hypothetical protein